MKVKKVKSDKSKFGLRDLRINLTRLDKETIRRHLGLADVQTFNVHITM